MPRLKPLALATVSCIAYSISAQLIFPFCFLSPSLLTSPLALLFERHRLQPSMVPWAEADRLLQFTSALASIILGTAKEGCLELLCSSCVSHVLQEQAAGHMLLTSGSSGELRGAHTASEHATSMP